MAVAILYPEPETGGRGKKAKALETSGFSRQRLGQARAVLRHSTDLALAVRGGARKLDEALDEAKAAQERRQSVGSAKKRLSDEVETPRNVPGEIGATRVRNAISRERVGGRAPQLRGGARLCASACGFPNSLDNPSSASQIWPRSRRASSVRTFLVEDTACLFPKLEPVLTLAFGI